MNDDESFEMDHVTEEEEIFDTFVDEEIIDNWTVDGIQPDIDIDCNQVRVVSLVKKCREFVSMIKRSSLCFLIPSEIYVMTSSPGEIAPTG